MLVGPVLMLLQVVNGPSMQNGSFFYGFGRFIEEVLFFTSSTTFKPINSIGIGLKGGFHFLHLNWNIYLEYAIRYSVVKRKILISHYGQMVGRYISKNAFIEHAETLLVHPTLTEVIAGNMPCKNTLYHRRHIIFVNLMSSPTI